MKRRTFLRGGITAAASMITQHRSSALQSKVSPILDAHVHLFDPERPGGVPWPEPGDPIRTTTLPQRLERLAAPLGVVGAIAIEASPLHADNDWLLHVVSQSPYMVGMVGNLTPDAATFTADLDRLHRTPLFLGIRYGNLWNHDLAVDWRRAGFMQGLTLLAEAGLVLETANPTPSLLEAVLHIAQQLPSLRIVLDHVPHMPDTTDAEGTPAALATLRALAQSPTVFLKFSEVLPAPSPAYSAAPARSASDWLDLLWDLFGPHRVLFGSDWPNSEHVASYTETLGAVQRYLARRAPAATNDVLFRNSRNAYRWRARTAAQQQLG